MQNSAVGAARSYGSLTILPRAEQMTISTVYSTMDQFADIEKDEQWAWAELRSITEDRDLTDSDKASLRQAIQRARYSAWLLRTTAEQAIAEAKADRGQARCHRQRLALGLRADGHALRRSGAAIEQDAAIASRASRRTRPSRPRNVQRPIISAATTPGPLARPVQMPTPCQPRSNASQTPTPSPTTQ